MSGAPLSRHEQLLAAHWRYDATRALYALPNGTLWYTQSEAWKLHQASVKERPHAT
jgi:hypothetical protein